MSSILNRIATLFGVAFLFVFSAKAQDPYCYTDQLSYSDGDLNLQGRFDSRFFFINNEYFTPQVEGYTLVGYTLRPTVIWQFNEDISFVGGLHMLQYGGEDRVHKVSPYFAADWSIIPNRMHLRMGNLVNPDSHLLHDAVLNVESSITQKPELGFQFSYRSANGTGYCQLWLNWRQFIFMGDTIPEKFSAGITGSFAKGPLYVPASVVFNHVGGQISNYPERMQSLANFSIEPQLTILNNLSLSFRAFFFKAMAGADVRPFSKGRALSPELNWWVKGDFSNLLLKADLAWFRGHDFFSPLGNYMYSSLSNYSDSYVQNRSLASLSLNLSKIFWGDGNSSASFNFNAKGFYDTFERRFDYAYGLSICLSPRTPR